MFDRILISPLDWSMVIRESEESKIKTIKSKQRSLKELQARFPVGKYLDNKFLKILQKNAA